MYATSQNEPRDAFPKEGIISDLQIQAYEKLLLSCLILYLNISCKIDQKMIETIFSQRFSRYQIATVRNLPSAQF